MKYFWTSFFFTGEDERPLTFPPNEFILGWWNTGMRCSDEASTIVIWVKGNDETEAREHIAMDWPESLTSEWRFFEEQPGLVVPGDRFPLSDWSQKRVDAELSGVS